MTFDGAEHLLGQVAEGIVLDKNGTGGDCRLETLFVLTGISFDQQALHKGNLIVKGRSSTFLLTVLCITSVFITRGLFLYVLNGGIILSKTVSPLFIKLHHYTTLILPVYVWKFFFLHPSLRGLSLPGLKFLFLDFY